MTRSYIEGEEGFFHSSTPTSLEEQASAPDNMATREETSASKGRLDLLERIMGSQRSFKRSKEKLENSGEAGCAF